MSKRIIAVDIDDVLAASTDAVRKFVNERYSLDLQESHYQIKAEYWGYYEAVWDQHDLNGDGILDEFHAQYVINQSNIDSIKGAVEVLTELANRYRLVAVSSRRQEMQPETERWIRHTFGDVFEVVRCISSRDTKIDKGEACFELGASFLIDDNVQHCISAKQQGIQPILFGEYGWQHEQEIPIDLVRCMNWCEVSEYFHGKS